MRRYAAIAMSGQRSPIASVPIRQLQCDRPWVTIIGCIDAAVISHVPLALPHGSSSSRPRLTELGRRPNWLGIIVSPEVFMSKFSFPATSVTARLKVPRARLISLTISRAPLHPGRCRLACRTPQIPLRSSGNCRLASESWSCLTRRA
jgi:hypothetical protein